MSGRIEDLTDERLLSREGQRDHAALWSASSRRGVVVAAHYHASAAGAEVLEAGGNVIDAAIATSLALGVVEPAASGLGGMGMMLFHDAQTGRTTCLEGACRAPKRATPEQVAQGPRKNTHHAVALPGLPALLGHVHQHFGTKELGELCAPAIRLASEGYPTTSFQQHLAQVYERPLKRLGCAAHFLGDDGEPKPPGTWFRQPALAQTLLRLSDVGFEDFYIGEVGRKIVKDMSAHQGFLSALDFETVPEIGQMEPLVGHFGTLDIRTLPPPGGGVTLLQLLHLFDEVAPERFEPDTPDGALLFAMLVQQARMQRRAHPRGKVRLDDGSVVSVTDSRYLQRVATELRESLEGGETSHFCILDSAGNAVAMTQSLERSFGAKVVTPELGFLYNGYLKTFKLENRKHPFFLRPGLPARSNAAPTIALRNGQVKLVIGSTGSERMVSSIFQVMTRLRFGQAPFEAVAAPRLHCTPVGEVLLEAERFSPVSRRRLERAGFVLSPYPAWAFEVGGLHLAVAEEGNLIGVAEPRRDGATAAL